MKKDLNLLKVKDVTVKSSTNTKKSALIFLIIGLIIILLVGLLLFKTMNDASDSAKKLADIKSQIDSNQITLSSTNSKITKRRLENRAKQTENNKLIIDVQTAESHKGSLKYGIIQDIIEHPDGKGTNTTKKSIGDLTDMTRSSYMMLSTSPKYSFSDSGFSTTLNWTIYAKSSVGEPDSGSIDIYDKDYVVEKYRSYIAKMLTDVINQNDMTKVKINNFKQQFYSGTGEQDKPVAGYERFTLIVDISINSSDYDSVISTLNQKYGYAN